MAGSITAFGSTGPLKLLVIYNPGAASGRAAKVLADIRAHFGNLGIATTLLSTARPGDGAHLVADADLADYDGVVAAGGDGTVSEVLNGLWSQPASRRVPLGVLPVGTGNAFARDLGLGPFDWPAAMQLLQRGRSRKIDVGRVEAADCHYCFLNVVGMGFAVYAGQTAQRIKAVGSAAYTLATLWQTIKLKPYPLVVRIGDEEIRQSNILLTISNTRFTGTHFKIAPGARLDNGRFDVTLVRDLPRLRLLRLFPTVYDGRHVDFPEVTVRQARHVRIFEPKGMLLGPDGEFRGRTPATLTCLERKLAVFC